MDNNDKWESFLDGKFLLSRRINFSHSGLTSARVEKLCDLIKTGDYRDLIWLDIADNKLLVTDILLICDTVFNGSCPKFIYLNCRESFLPHHNFELFVDTFIACKDKRRDYIIDLNFSFCHLSEKAVKYYIEKKDIGLIPNNVRLCISGNQLSKEFIRDNITSKATYALNKNFIL